MKKIILITLLICIPVTVLTTVLLNTFTVINHQPYKTTLESNILSSNSTRTSLNNQINESRENMITNTVRNVSPAVVGINVTEVHEIRDPFANFFEDPFFKDDPTFRRFFGDRSYKQEVRSIGSGFIISSDGFVITNDHVAGNAKKIVVTLTNGEKYDAEIIGTDYVSDICLLKIKGNNFPFIKLGNSDDVIIGEWVVALGNPFGLFELNDKPTVTVGVISQTNINLEPLKNRFYRKMLQTDAAINGGNSGGPLVNSLGEVIGMNTIIYTGNQYNTGNVGIGFAIPINKLKSVITELKNNKKLDREFWTGLSIQTLNDGIAKYFGLKKNVKGVVVTQIDKNSPAEKAKLEAGDIITEVNNEKVTDENDVRAIFQEFRTGQIVPLKIIRDNKDYDIKLKLENRK